MTRARPFLVAAAAALAVAACQAPDPQVVVVRPAPQAPVVTECREYEVRNSTFTMDTRDNYTVTRCTTR